MYTYEIEQLLKLRNYLIDSEEYINMCMTSPQIKHIKYNPYENKIEISTNEDKYFKFKVYRKEK